MVRLQSFQCRFRVCALVCACALVGTAFELVALRHVAAQNPSGLSNDLVAPANPAADSFDTQAQRDAVAAGVPGPPTAPIESARPNSWPTDLPPAAQTPTQESDTDASPLSDGVWPNTQVGSSIAKRLRARDRASLASRRKTAPAPTARPLAAAPQVVPQAVAPQSTPSPTPLPRALPPSSEPAADVPLAEGPALGYPRAHAPSGAVLFDPGASLPGDAASPISGYPQAQVPSEPITQAPAHPVAPSANYPVAQPPAPPVAEAPSYPVAKVQPTLAPTVAPEYPEATPSYPQATPAYPDASPTYPQATPTYPQATPTYPDATQNAGNQWTQPQENPAPSIPPPAPLSRNGQAAVPNVAAGPEISPAFPSPAPQAFPSEQPPAAPSFEPPPAPAFPTVEPPEFVQSPAVASVEPEATHFAPHPRTLPTPRPDGPSTWSESVWVAPLPEVVGATDNVTSQDAIVSAPIDLSTHGATRSDAAVHDVPSYENTEAPAPYAAESSTSQQLPSSDDQLAYDPNAAAAVSEITAPAAADTPTAGPALGIPGPVLPPAQEGSFEQAADAQLRMSTTPLRDIDQATIIARVNGDVILAGEILPGVNETLEMNKDKIPASEFEEIRRQLMRQRLEPMIETKLLYEAAIRKIPEDKLPDIEQRLNTEFEKEPLARMMKQSGCETRQQLDVKLRTFGSALDKERRNFRMQVIARQWLQGQIKVREDISRDEMLRYYREHAADYERPAQAKWQEVVLRLDRFSSRDEAVRALAEIGNRLIAGAPMAEEAKRHSHGREAAEGGLHDWTTQGSLVSVETDRALFSLPVGRLSPIIEDDRNVRIVTVIERNDAGRVPFADTQDAIRTKIREDRFEQARTDFLAKLRQDAYVWTVFDGQLPAPNLEDTSTARKP